jgi:propane monooxygenase reductase subunit
MARRHTVRFEPVGIELDAYEDETILEAAFRQGITLPHGCKEGQCSACKSFLLAGEVALERYSTFALADNEQDEGYTLLCRAHAYSDLEVELLHYDEETLTSGLPIRTVKTTVAAIEPLTRDVSMLRLALPDEDPLRFHPGQYVDIHIPGTGDKRSFSMCNAPNTDRLEFMVKIYPGGRFSGLLSERLAPGDELDVTGPYGVFMLREHSDADLIFIGGGTGMAPIWSLLSSLAERGIERRVTYYHGARALGDLFWADELALLSERLPGFRVVAALSEPSPGEKWDGEIGLITDVVDRLEGELSGSDAYVAGRPSMIDASVPMLVAHGMPEARIFYEKFTVTAAEKPQPTALAGDAVRPGGRIA